MRFHILSLLVLVGCTPVASVVAPVSESTIEDMVYVRCFDSNTLSEINVSVGYQVVFFPHGVLATCTAMDGRTQASWTVLGENDENGSVDTSCSVMMDGVGTANGGYWIFHLNRDLTVRGEYRDPDLTRQVAFIVTGCVGGNLMRSLDEAVAEEEND